MKTGRQNINQSDTVTYWENVVQIQVQQMVGNGDRFLMNSTLCLSSKLKLPATDATAGFFIQAVTLPTPPHPHPHSDKNYIWFQPSDTKAITMVIN